MRKMRVATTGLGLKHKEKLTELSFKLPKGAEILSAQLEHKDDDYTLWLTYITPSEAYEDGVKHLYPWTENRIFVCDCTYTEIDIHEHKYIGNITVDNMPCAVFVLSYE